MRTFLIIFTCIVLLAGFSAQFVFAQQQCQQGQLCLIAPIPTLNSNVVPDPANYISALYQFGLGIAGALAMLMIIWGALQWVVSGAIDKKAAAKQKIKNAILGLILLLASVLILNIISPNLTNLQTIIPPL